MNYDYDLWLWIMIMIKIEIFKQVVVSCLFTSPVNLEEYLVCL